MSASVLIVDDEPNMLRLLEYALQAEGYEAVTAQDGKQALEQIQAARPDLAVLDVMLPDMSGTEICQRLRSEPKTVDLPIIMLSARARVLDKISGLEAGADEYVTKPVDPDELVARVKALLGRTSRLRQTKPVRHGKVLGFIGAKGGVGTTTVALNVAAALARQKKEVAVVELTPYHGAFSAQLGEAMTGNLTTLLDAERIDERELDKRLFNSRSGFRVLCSGEKVDEFREIQPGQAEAVINGLSRLADYVIIDLPCHPSAAIQAAVRLCSLVALVLEAEPVCVLSGRRTLGLLRSWGTCWNSVGAVVVRRAALTLPTPPSEIESQLDCPILGIIPPAAHNLKLAVHVGAPLVLSEADGIAAASLTELANRLAADKLIFVSL